MLSTLRIWISPFRHRGYRVIASAGALSLIGSSITSLALPLFIVGAGGSAAFAGVLATLRLVGTMIMPLLGGVLTDRWPRRTMFITADAVRAACLSAVLLVVVTSPANGFVIIGVAVLIEGLVGALLAPALPAAIRTSLEGDNLQQGMVAWQSLSISTMMIGPLLGGVLLYIAPALPFAMNVLSYLASLLIILLSRVDFGGGTNRTKHVASFRVDIATSLRYAFGNRYLRAYGFGTSVLNVTSAAALFALPIVVTRNLPQGDVLAGAAVSAFAVCGLIGTILANFVRTQRDLLMFTLLMATVGAAYLTIGVTRSPWALIAIMAATALLIPPLQIRLSTRTIEAISEHELGKAQGSLALIAAAFYPFAGTIAGLLLDGTGPWWTFGILGAATFAPMLLYPISALRLPSGDAAIASLESLSSEPAQHEG